MTESTSRTEAAIGPAQFLERFMGVFGRFFGLFAGVTTILYALGFVIVNTSLLRHGVYEFRLVQAQFVAAGLSCLFYLAFLVSIAIVVHALISWMCKKWLGPWLGSREGEGRPNLIRRLLNRTTRDGQFIDEWIVVVLGIVLSPPVLLFLLASPIWRRWTAPGLGLLNDFKAVFTWAWITLVLAWLYVLFIRPWIVNRVTTIGRIKVSPMGRGALETLVLFLVFIPTLFLYGKDVYHRIPPSFGGGSPMIVQFVVDEAARPRLRALGIVTNELGLTEKMELIAQSENRFIVLTQQEERAVSLNTGDVQATVYYIGYRGTAQRYNELGVQRAQAERYEDAISLYDQAILLDKGFLPAYLNRGVAYLERAKQEKEKGQGDQQVLDRYRYLNTAEADFTQVIDDTLSGCPALAGVIRTPGEGLAEAIDVALHECPALAEAIQAPGEDLIGVIDVAAMRGDRGHILHLAYYHHARTYAIQESLSEEDSEQAVEDLQKAIALAPPDRNAVRAEHDFEPFLRESKFVRTIFGSFENAAREYNKQATDFVQEGDLQEAEWSYSWALALIDQAGDKTTDAQKKDRLLSEQASLHTGLADLYAKQAKWDLALAEHEKAIADMVEAGMDDVAYLRRSELVEALYSGGQMDRAIEKCEDWGKEFETHPSGAIACGSVYRDSQDFDNALDSYTQAISYTQTISYTQIISTTADLAEAYYQRARLYARQSEAELFLGDLAEATRRNYSLIARSAFEPDFSAFQRDSRFRQLMYPNIERIDVKDETTLIFNLPAPSPAFQFRLIALMRLEGLPPLISYQEKTGEGVQAQADMSVSQDKLVWTFRLREDAPYKASELQAQLLQTPSLGQEAQVPSEPITPVSDSQGYTVSSGDDLEGLADKFLGDPHLYPAIIYATNQKHAEDETFAKIPAPAPLEPGWKIYIPGLGGDVGQEYVVQAEDSLEMLAYKFLDDSEAYPAIIYATNQKHAEDETFAKIPAPGPLEPGWKIYIPSREEAKVYFEGLFMP